MRSMQSMRSILLPASVMVLGAFGALGASACSDSSSSSAVDPNTPNDDAGSSGAIGSSGGTGPGSSGNPGDTDAGSSGDDGGSDDGGDNDAGPITITPTTLKAGAVAFLGVTTDATPHAVYVAAGAGGARSLEAVPVAGGAAIVIAPSITATDRPLVTGGAVGWFTNVTGGVGTLNVWTKANGAKLAVTTSAFANRSFISASADGSRIAFSVGVAAGAAPTTIDMAVTSTAAPVATAVLTGAGALNVAAGAAGGPCEQSLGFVGTTFFGAYCTGTDAEAEDARLVTISAATSAPTVLVDNGAGAGIRPFWAADAAGSKLFVVGLPGGATPNQGKIVTVATGAVVNVDGNVQNGAMLADGSGALYLSGGAVKTATATATPTLKTLATGAKGVFPLAADQKRALFATLDPSGNYGTVDLKSIDTTTANQTPVDLVATATAMPFGFDATGAYAVYLTDPGPSGATLKSKPATGGAEQTLATEAIGVVPPKTGTGLIAATKPVVVQQRVLVGLSYVNAKGGAPIEIVDANVPYQGGYVFAGNKLVYTVVSAMGGGIYAATIP